MSLGSRYPGIRDLMNELARVILGTLSTLSKQPLRAVGWLLKTLYAIFAGPLDDRCAVKGAVAFGRELNDSLRFVIDAYGGEVIPIVPRREIRGFDYVEALIKVGPLRLSVSRCRGTFSAYVAPAFDPFDRQELIHVLNACGDRQITGGYFRDQWDLAAQLEPQLDCLLQWMTPDRYPELKRRLDAK